MIQVHLSLADISPSYSKRFHCILYCFNEIAFFQSEKLAKWRNTTNQPRTWSLSWKIHFVMRDSSWCTRYYSSTLNWVLKDVQCKDSTCFNKRNPLFLLCHKRRGNMSPPLWNTRNSRWMSANGLTYEKNVILNSVRSSEN